MSDWRRLVGRLGRRVRVSAERVRGPGPGPRVCVVVVVRGPAPFLGACIASVLGGGHRAVEVLLAPLDPAAATAVAAGARGERRLRGLPAGAQALDVAVREALGSGADYLTFVDADHELAEGALPSLVGALEDSGSDLAVGPVALVRGGEAAASPWSDTLFAGRLTGQQVGSCPDVLVGATPTGTLYRTSSWQSAGVRIAEWDDREVAAVELLLGAGGFDVVPGTAYLAHARDVSLPVEEQARFRPAAVARQVGGLRRVASMVAATDAAVYRRWLVLTLSHRLPPLLVDAVGGGPRSLEVLAPLVRDLVAEVGPGAVAEVPVAARMLLRASQGALHDVAVVSDLVADNPHGLPTERSAEGAQVVRLPTGLAVPVPDAMRRIEPVDRVMRTVVGPLRRDDLGGLLVEGAAFVEYGERSPLPTVLLVGADDRAVPMRVDHRDDPEINLWARRAWEDRTGAGFTARLEPGLEPPGTHGRWRVEVHLGRRAASHDVALPDVPRGQEVLLGAALEDPADGPPVLVLHARGSEAGTVGLTGAKGATGAVPVQAAAGGWTARVPLVTDLFGEQVLLPPGRYAVTLTGTTDGPAAATWSREAVHAALLSDRLRVVPGAGPGDAAAVTVAAPLGADERSAFDQQRLQRQLFADAAGTDDRLVVLETFRGRSVGDNPGAIGREIARRGLDLDLAWVVDDSSVTVPAGTRALPRRSARWYDALGRARVLVSNAGAPYWYAKPPGQIHLQTWHGTPLKRIGEDRGPGDFATWRHRRRIALQAAGWDAMISPSGFCSERFRSAFRFDGRFLEVGYPRNDVLLDERRDPVREQVRQRLRLGREDRVVLYAPTWREYVGIRDSKPLYLDAQELLRLVPDAVVLLRGHYNATHQADVFRGEPRIIDVTRYPDIADLYLAADVLVTDYSSVMFDFALTDKPQVLLVPDLAQYRDVERGFYLDLEAEAPGPMVTSTEAVAAALLGPDEHGDRRAAFRDRFCPWDDGLASARTVDWLLSQI